MRRCSINVCNEAGAFISPPESGSKQRNRQMAGAPEFAFTIPARFTQRGG